MRQSFFNRVVNFFKLPNDESGINNIAFNSEQVKSKYKKYHSFDPFPSIPPALLNTEDIHNYAITTGMINPYCSDELKHVTYGVKGGAFLYWELDDHGQVIKKQGRFDDNNNKLITKNAANERVFVLKKNSIVYVSLESEFYLPFYITARFNLKISYIHQGILLGTGPVIDPGFVGNICIPLHNLTNHDCEILVEKPIIQVEFTKLNTHSDWLQSKNRKLEVVKDGLPWSPLSMPTKFIPAPENLSAYLLKAKPHQPVYSSIAGLAEKTEGLAKKAIDKAEGLNTKVLVIIIVSVIAIAVAIGGFSIRAFYFDRNYREEIRATQNQIHDLNIKIDSLSTIIFDLKNESNSSNSDIQEVN